MNSIVIIISFILKRVQNLINKKSNQTKPTLEKKGSKFVWNLCYSKNIQKIKETQTIGTWKK